MFGSPLNRLKYTEMYIFSINNVMMDIVQSHCQKVQIVSLYLSSHIHLYLIQQHVAQSTDTNLTNGSLLNIIRKHIFVKILAIYMRIYLLYCFSILKAQ